MVLQNFVPSASDDVSLQLQQQEDQQRLLYLQQLLGGASSLSSRPSTITRPTTTISTSITLPSMATCLSSSIVTPTSSLSGGMVYSNSMNVASSPLLYSGQANQLSPDVLNQVVSIVVRELSKLTAASSYSYSQPQSSVYTSTPASYIPPPSSDYNTVTTSSLYQIPGAPACSLSNFLSNFQQNYGIHLSSDPQDSFNSASDR